MEHVIKEIHQLLTVNAASVESELGGGQNGYLGIILPPKEYARISNTPFVCPPPPRTGKNGNCPSMDAAQVGEAPPLIKKGGEAPIRRVQGSQHHS